jgi:exodeoxyribonuclease VII small subunit
MSRSDPLDSVSASAQAPASSPASAPDLEARIRRLESIVQRLESGDLPLEEGLALFEEGVGHIRESEQLLARAELRVEELVAEGAAGVAAAAPDAEGGA